MRFRLLRRRLTISAPRVAVRNALPWPLRWLLAALLLGFSAALALWAFEFGKSIAGLDSGSREELVRLREEVGRLHAESRQQQEVAATAGSLLTAERAALERVQAQMRQLEADNRALRDDLGFFEKLIPAGKSDGISIRGLQVERQGGLQMRWQVLVIQPVRNAPEFKGRLELVLSGAQNGQPWSSVPPVVSQSLQFQQYRRAEGMIDLPEGVMVQTVTARVLEGSTVRTVHSVDVD
ncbi:DUF6776 family protein [Paracidovorax wautersii]|uniref:DUF6776 family protein n=1 Tax=Paracidovorax wautersii TaxID=1177982 RepID=UPI0031D08B09